MMPPPPLLGCAEANANLAAYALDALPPAERRRVAAHLRVCVACPLALARYEEVIGALGTAAVPAAPSAALRRRLLVEIGATGNRAAAPGPESAPPRHLPTEIGAGDPSVSPRWRRAALALALAAALLLVGLGVAGVFLHRSLVSGGEIADDRQEIAEYLRNGGTMTALIPAAGAEGLVQRGQGSLIVAPNQPRALLIVAGLPPTDAGRRYRVWVARNGQRTWVGELTVATDGSGYLLVAAPAPMPTYQTLGIARGAPGSQMRDLLWAPVPRSAPN